MKNVSLSEKDKDRLYTLRILCIEAVVASVVFSVIYTLAGSTKSGIFFLLAIPLTAATYFIWRLFLSPAAVGNWVLGFGYFLLLVSAYWTGGIEAPVLYWSAAIPMVAILICGQRSGIFWLVMVLLKISGFYYIYKTGIVPMPPTPFHDGMLPVVLSSSMAGIILFTFFPILITERLKDRNLKRLEEKNAELFEAIKNVKLLREMLPICAWCHKVRNDKGYWDRIETYFKEHGNVEFSHGICPDCQATKLKG